MNENLYFKANHLAQFKADYVKFSAKYGWSVEKNLRVAHPATNLEVYDARLVDLKNSLERLVEEKKETEKDEAYDTVVTRLIVIHGKKAYIVDGGETVEEKFAAKLPEGVGTRRVSKTFKNFQNHVGLVARWLGLNPKAYSDIYTIMNYARMVEKWPHLSTVLDDMIKAAIPVDEYFKKMPGVKAVKFSFGLSSKNSYGKIATLALPGIKFSMFKETDRTKENVADLENYSLYDVLENPRIIYNEPKRSPSSGIWEHRDIEVYKPAKDVLIKAYITRAGKDESVQMEEAGSTYVVTAMVEDFAELSQFGEQILATKHYLSNGRIKEIHNVYGTTKLWFEGSLEKSVITAPSKIGYAEINGKKIPVHIEKGFTKRENQNSVIINGLERASKEFEVSMEELQDVTLYDINGRPMKRKAKFLTLSKVTVDYSQKRGIKVSNKKASSAQQKEFTYKTGHTALDMEYVEKMSINKKHRDMLKETLETVLKLYNDIQKYGIETVITNHYDKDKHSLFAIKNPFALKEMEKAAGYKMQYATFYTMPSGVRKIGINVGPKGDKRFISIPEIAVDSLGRLNIAGHPMKVPTMFGTAKLSDDSVLVFNKLTTAIIDFNRLLQFELNKLNHVDKELAVKNALNKIIQEVNDQLVKVETIYMDMLTGMPVIYKGLKDGVILRTKDYRALLDKVERAKFDAIMSDTDTKYKERVRKVLKEIPVTVFIIRDPDLGWTTDVKVVDIKPAKTIYGIGITEALAARLNADCDGDRINIVRVKNINGRNLPYLHGKIAFREWKESTINRATVTQEITKLFEDAKTNVDRLVAELRYDGEAPKPVVTQQKDIPLVLHIYAKGKYSNKFGNKAIYGVALTEKINDDEYIITEKVGTIKSESRHIIAELAAISLGLREAYEFGKKHNHKVKVTIHYNYNGIEKWVNGEWEAKKDYAVKFVQTINVAKKFLEIEFVKQEANEFVVGLAEKIDEETSKIIKEEEE
ncbi:MAG: hypothetical protein B6I31_03820 [Desulfobacteraceae bacterium 4572_19]|nr:MAG: hypothetical protein B6I31_03820 [Desulfobacteraceae bacterium 4572_19]